MPIEYQLLLLVAIGFIAGVILVFFIMYSKSNRLIAQGKSEAQADLLLFKERLSEREKETLTFKKRVQENIQKINQLESEKNDLDKKLAVANEKNEKIPTLEGRLKEKEFTLNTLQTENRELSSSLAQEVEKNKQIRELHNEIITKNAALEEIRHTNTNQKALIAELKTRSAEERSKLEEQRQTLLQAKKELSDQFKTLAQEIFEEKGKQFTEQNQVKLDTLLNPFRQQLTDFRKKVDDVYVNEAKERASLKKELENLQLLNKQISQEAVNLTNALKGDVKIRGNWGELILERVLEQSGLRKGVEYETQSGFRDQEDNLLRPDVVIHLPDQKDIVVDSKVSLTEYEKYSSTTEDATREVALKAHIIAIRRHIESLSEKDYSSLKGIQSLDFVLMFIPIEASFVVAFQHDEKLFSDAFSKRIIVVTPTTLLATLKTIENIWRYERQSQNAQAIVERAGLIYDKIRGFVEDMEKLGKQLSTASRTWDDAMKKLTLGKGNLVSQAQQFVEMGVKVKKKVPKTITAISEIQSQRDERPALEPKVDGLIKELLQVDETDN